MTPFWQQHNQRWLHFDIQMKSFMTNLSRHDPWEISLVCLMSERFTMNDSHLRMYITIGKMTKKTLTQWSMGDVSDIPHRICEWDTSETPVIFFQYLHAYVCVYTCMCSCRYIYIYWYIYTHTHAYSVHLYMRIRVFINTSEHAYADMGIHTSIDSCIHALKSCLRWCRDHSTWTSQSVSYRDMTHDNMTHGKVHDAETVCACRDSLCMQRQVQIVKCTFSLTCHRQFVHVVYVCTPHVAQLWIHKVSVSLDP